MPSSPNEHGRRSDPKLFNVPNDSHVHNTLGGEGDERPHLDVDLQMLVDTLLGPDDAAAALSASKMPALISPGRALSLDQLTLQGGQTSASSALKVEPVNNDAAPLPTPMEGLQAGSLDVKAGSNSDLQRISELQQGCGRR